MKLLQDKTNVTLPNSEFPYGQIRDRDGVTPGTPGSVEVYGDMHQFFEKLIRESSITPNGLLDSEYNGYQLWEAFLEHIGNFNRFYVNISQSLTAAPTFQERISDIGTPVASYVSTGKYQLTFPTSVLISSAGYTHALFGFNAFGSTGFAKARALSSTVLDIWTYDAAGTLADGILSNTYMELKVYPV